MLHSIGTDLEVFATNSSGEHKAICGLIGGTKDEPLQIQDRATGFSLQEDNVALEFNIPPAYAIQNFVESIKLMREVEVPKVLKKCGYKISNKSSVSFSPLELQHPNALIFGCEPDYNAWKITENSKPYSSDETLRTAGGHIHVGSNVDFILGVKHMDLFLGVPSILLDDNEGSIKRRELYGKAGSMRVKPYGWEYRTLSNFWMFSDELVSWVFKSTVRAVNYEKSISTSDGHAIQECINNGNKQLAKELISSYGITLPAC